MDFQALLKNKSVLYGVIGGAVLLIIIVIMVIVMNSGSGENKEKKEPVINKPITILRTKDTGKALEIQALLAKEKIYVERVPDGSNSILKMNKYTESQRDRALMAIVKSGLMDKNIGLEIFDKGDFTSSKSDKKIRLARAINGELARLVKKIESVRDASVFVSIPKDTIYSSRKSSPTATVQLVLASGQKLDRNRVKAITNLLLGSIPDLTSQNISITDTNGNVYNNLISAGDSRMELLEENDVYMKSKIMAQLDRLIGKGNYVVTVSTYLREAPLETNRVLYNPDDSAVKTKQIFNEGLGDSSSASNKLSAGVSSFIPGGLPATPKSKNDRKYTREAQEYQYRIGKTHFAETKMPGMLEEISIAVTINRDSIPSDMKQQELKELIARSASPKALAENVKIAFADMTTPILASDRPVVQPEPESSGNPWWTVAALLGATLIGGLVFIASRVKSLTNKQQKEIEELLEKTQQQQTQINETQDQNIQLKQIQESIQKAMIQGGTHPSLGIIQDTVKDIRKELDEEELNELEIADQLKSWIENTK